MRRDSRHAHGRDRPRTRDPVQEPIVPLHSETFVWRRDNYPLPWSVWNSHPECEVHLIGNAQGTCYVGDHISPFAPGDLFLVGRSLPHNWVTPLEASEMIEGRDILIQFDEDRLLRAAEELPELGRVARLMQVARRGLSFHGRGRRDGATLVEAIGSATGLRRLALFFELLHLLATSDEVRVLSSSGFAPSPTGATNEILQIVMRQMVERFGQDLRLSDLAATAGMTETSFSRFFKKNTGNTFTRHLSELRIGQACRMLAGTGKAITEICHDVGYLNLSNFNRAFRELRGMTPGHYRRLSLMTVNPAGHKITGSQQPAR